MSYLLGKFLVFIVVGYLLICLAVFLFQNKLLYHPDTANISEASAEQLGLKHWPSFNEHRGFISTSNNSEQPLGTVVVFHGNGGAAYHRTYYIDALSRLCYRVVLAEYPAYGGRSGTLGEEMIVADAMNTLQQISAEFSEPMYLWGESLGSGVVASLVKRINSAPDIVVRGLILFTPWDSLADVAQTHYPFLPARWLVKDKFDSVANLNQFTGNVAVILAGQDKVIPVSHGVRLFDSIQSRKQVWRFAAAAHNTVPVQPELSWWQDVMNFVANEF